MANLTLDIIDGGGMGVNSRGWRARRIAKLGGLTLTTQAGIYAAMYSSSITTSTGERMPQYGDPHPGIPGIIVNNIDVSQVDQGICEAAIDYGVPEVATTPPSETAPAQIEVGATVQEVETSLDVNGQLMTVGKFVDDGTALVLEIQTGTVRKQIPSVYFRYRRREPFSPGAKAKFHVGTMNSISVFDDPPKYWLCTGITGTSNDFGASYDVNYEFLRNEETWDAVVAWVDPSTGRIPTDVVFNGTNTGGLVRHVIYRTTNFYDLNI